MARNVVSGECLFLFRLYQFAARSRAAISCNQTKKGHSMTKTMKAQMPRKFYVITLPCDDQGNHAPETGTDRFIVAYKHKGSWRWQSGNVFDTEADAEKCMYAEQMREFYFAIDDAWYEGVKKGHFEEYEDRGNYLC